VAGGFGDGGDATHEGAANTENVDMHDVLQTENGKAARIPQSSR